RSRPRLVFVGPRHVEHRRRRARIGAPLRPALGAHELAGVHGEASLHGDPGEARVIEEDDRVAGVEAEQPHPREEPRVDHAPISFATGTWSTLCAWATP